MCLKNKLMFIERNICELKRLQRENNYIVRNLQKLSPDRHSFLYERYSRNAFVIEKSDLLNYNKLKQLLSEIPL